MRRLVSCEAELVRGPLTVKQLAAAWQCALQLTTDDTSKRKERVIQVNLSHAFQALFPCVCNIKQTLPEAANPYPPTFSRACVSAPARSDKPLMTGADYIRSSAKAAL